MINSDYPIFDVELQFIWIRATDKKRIFLIRFHICFEKQFVKKTTCPLIEDPKIWGCMG